jgi:hypothetical protein
MAASINLFVGAGFIQDYRFQRSSELWYSSAKNIAKAQLPILGSSCSKFFNRIRLLWRAFIPQLSRPYFVDD